MNDISGIAQTVIGAITLAASRDAQIRAEILQVGDPVRVLRKKNSYNEDREVLTGVIVGFEPFEKLPTVIVAVVESGFGSAKMDILYYNDQSKDAFEIIAAPPGAALAVEKAKVLDYFASEEKKKLAEIDDLRAKRDYFNRYFGSVFAEIEATAEPVIEAAPES